MSNNNTYLNIVFNSYEEVTRHATKDQWDRDDTYTSWSLEEAVIIKEKGFFDVVAPFEVKDGDSILVVYAIYSTGDSFGVDECGRCEVIDVFKTIDLAAACERVIEGTEKPYDSKNSGSSEVRWTREDGSEGKLDYVPWSGYFESLDSVRCETARVRSK